jgi:hypothetical protein
MLLVMFGVLLILGMFMEQISIMLLTVPIFFPLATQLGFDPIWFGLIMLLALEISFTTPPFGLLLFVMKGSRHRTRRCARSTGGVPLHPVFAAARRAPDRVSDPRDLVAEPRLRPVGYSSRKARLKYTVSGCVR